MPSMRKSPDPDYQDISHEEEEKARKAFLKGLRGSKWKKIEIEAAEAGWEWAFDVGFETPDLDSDAAGDLADCVLDGSKRYSREALADCVYEGICAARKAMRVPEEQASA